MFMKICEWIDRQDELAFLLFLGIITVALIATHRKEPR